MKYFYFLFLGMGLFLASCNSSNSSNPDDVQTDTINSGTVEIDSSDFTNNIVNIPSLWKVELQDNQVSEKLKKPDNDELGKLTPQKLVEALNASYPEIQLELKKISNDTVFVAIPNSEYFSNQLGNTGAYNYLASTVYNLTELTNVKFVNFDFPRGDHASPGTYSRDNFKRLR